MLNDYLQVYTVSIVFIGDFNPVIIQPFWLASKSLIREQEASDAEVEVVHNEITKFEIKNWLKVEVTRDRFELRTSQEPYFAPMKDLAISVFKYLNETPIKAVGINHLKYFALTSESDYFNFGDKLAPLHNWDEFLNNPKMMTLEIVEQKRKDKLSGSLTVRIQPSDIKLSTKYGVLININDHYSLSPDNKGKADHILALLGENWIASFERSSEVIEKIWDKISQ